MWIYPLPSPGKLPNGGGVYGGCHTFNQLGVRCAYERDDHPGPHAFLHNGQLYDGGGCGHPWGVPCVHRCPVVLNGRRCVREAGHPITTNAVLINAPSVSSGGHVYPTAPSTWDETGFTWDSTIVTFGGI